MKKIQTLTAALLASAFLTTPALSSELRIGLNDDADVLDPAQSRTFVGRIVYTAMCDKLVDISQDMKIVPQARHRMGLVRRRQGSDDEDP